MKSWRGGVKFQKKLRIPSSKFSHLWADHLAGPSNFSYAQLISTPCLQYIGFIRLGFLKVRVLFNNPFYQTSQCKSLNNKLSGWKLISVCRMWPMLPDLTRTNLWPGMRFRQWAGTESRDHFAASKASLDDKLCSNRAGVFHLVGIYCLIIFDIFQNDLIKVELRYSVGGKCPVMCEFPTVNYDCFALSQR